MPATTIPVGEDIAEYINNQLKDSDKEQAFALEAGKSYVLNGMLILDWMWLHFVVLIKIIVQR